MGFFPPPTLLTWSFVLAAILLGVLGTVLIFSGFASLMRGRLARSMLRTLTGMLLFTLGGLAGTIALGIQGYRALTNEDVAARVLVRPSGAQRIAATFRFADGREETFDLAGDEIYVDAHVLKWQPVANALGLRTGYELARVAGRYRDLDQERAAPRTVYSLGTKKTVDLFGMRQRYVFLAPLFDAEYGSATFVPVTQPAELELRVSSTGLLIREVKPAAK